MGNMKLPSHLTTEDFTRAVAAATVSALRHQSSVISHSASGHKSRVANVSAATEEEEHEGGGHESPNWTRGVSAGVLLGCTVLFAMIAGMMPLYNGVVVKRSEADDVVGQANDIDGFLVGGASLKPEFIDICKTKKA